MPATLSIGDKTIAPSDVIPLLDRYQLLSSLQRELIIDQAIASVHCTADEIAQSYQHLAEAQRVDPERLKVKLCDRYQLSSDELDVIVTRSLRVEKFKRATWETKLESRFLERKGQLDQVIYSLIRTQDELLASELYFRIEANEQTFAELALAYSEGLEAKMGGFVGPIATGKLHPSLAQILSVSQPGQLWFPQQIDGWFVILRLEERISAQFDQSIQQQLLQELFEEWITKQL
ncbi:MAG: hypothetical protein Kow00121_63900 [Elainellaceae cyanobacterium]